MLSLPARRKSLTFRLFSRENADFKKFSSAGGKIQWLFHDFSSVDQIQWLFKSKVIFNDFSSPVWTLEMDYQCWRTSIVDFFEEQKNSQNSKNVINVNCNIQHQATDLYQTRSPTLISQNSTNRNLNNIQPKFFKWHENFPLQQLHLIQIRLFEMWIFNIEI